MLPPACAQGADLHDNTHIPTSSFGLPAGLSAGPGKKFPRFSGVGLSLPCALRVAFMAAHRAWQQFSPEVTPAGGCRASEAAVWACSHPWVSDQTPSSSTPDAHFCVFQNRGVFCHFPWGGLRSGLGLSPGGPQRGFRRGADPPGASSRGRGQRRDARGPRVRPGALPARGLP